MLKRYLTDESGATAVEYGLIVGLISIAIMVVVGTIGDQIGNAFEQITEELRSSE